MHTLYTYICILDSGFIYRSKSSFETTNLSTALSGLGYCVEITAITDKKYLNTAACDNTMNRGQCSPLDDIRTVCREEYFTSGIRFKR